jgi:hypothetical protein
MNISLCKRCLVINCKRPAETTWEPDMRPGIMIPVCEEKERGDEKPYDVEEID